MAIDTSLFIADIPAGTYAVGDVVPLTIKEGPASVRTARGTPILKQITVGMILTPSTNLPTIWRIHAKSSDWVDEAISIAGSVQGEPTSFDVDSGLVQSGNNCVLTPNASWSLYAECVEGGTSTLPNTVFALIDVDYPQVSAIADPHNLQGFPASITFDIPSAIVNSAGSASSSSWQQFATDYFKAGAEYCLQAVELYTSGSLAGFVAFANAAGMGGLQRIIPINNMAQGIRTKISYASKLVKGPMDLKVMFFSPGSGTIPAFLVQDFVKRSS